MTGDESNTESPTLLGTTRKLRLRYAGTCSVCGTPQPAGTAAVYDRVRKSVACLACSDAAWRMPSLPKPTAATEPVADIGKTPSAATATAPVAVTVTATAPVAGTAGASALREFERRKHKRHRQVLDAHPRLGKFLIAVSDEPTSTRVWQTGALGEQELGRALDATAGNRVLVLHDRRIPGTRANIDHMAVGPGGVFVLDAKRYRGKRPERRVEGGLLRPRVEKLMVAGRDRTSLVDGIGRQVDLVDAALRKGGVTEAGVRGMLCFVDADWPLVGGSFRVRGHDVLWPRLAQKIIGSDGPLDHHRVTVLHGLLAASFPPA